MIVFKSIGQIVLQAIRERNKAIQNGHFNNKPKPRDNPIKQLGRQFKSMYSRNKPGI